MTAEVNRKKIPYCPLMSAGSLDPKVCLQESCAWYVHSARSCAAYVIAHNNLLDIKSKQGK